MEQPEGGGAARPCEDCAWYRTMINRAAGDPRPRAGLEALFGAHLRRNHAPEAPAEGRRHLRGL